MPRPNPFEPPVDPRGILAREYAGYAHRVLDPAGVPDHSVQRRETRMAWYAGAATMFDIMSNLAGPSDEPDEAGAARVEQVYQELQRYAASLAAGLT